MGGFIETNFLVESDRVDSCLEAGQGEILVVTASGRDGTKYTVGFHGNPANLRLYPLSLKLAFVYFPYTDTPAGESPASTDSFICSKSGTKLIDC